MKKGMLGEEDFLQPDMPLFYLEMKTPSCCFPKSGDKEQRNNKNAQYSTYREYHSRPGDAIGLFCIVPAQQFDTDTENRNIGKNINTKGGKTVAYLLMQQHRAHPQKCEKQWDGQSQGIEPVETPDQYGQHIQKQDHHAAIQYDCQIG